MVARFRLGEVGLQPPDWSDDPFWDAATKGKPYPGLPIQRVHITVVGNPLMFKLTKFT